MVTALEIGGCRIRVSFLLPITWIAMMVAGRNALFALTFLSVTLHEAAHALALRLFGLRISRIDLHPFGAFLVCEEGMEHRPGAEALMALAGPAMNLLLAWLGLCLWNFGILWEYGDLFVRINLAFALFNLLPALPMDGGHVLRASLSRQMGLGKATRAVAWVGIAVGAAAVAVGLSAAVRGSFRPEGFLVGAFLIVCGWRERHTAAWLGYREAEGKREALTRQGTLPVRQVAVASSSRLSAFLPKLAPRYYHIFTVLDEEGSSLGSFTEERFLWALRNRGGACTAGEVLARTVAS